MTDEALNDAPHFASLRKALVWRKTAGVVRHVFTHFPLELTVFISEVPPRTAPPRGTRWIKIAELDGEALPSLMRKVIAHALPQDRPHRK